MYSIIPAFVLSSLGANSSCRRKIRSCMKNVSCTSGCRCCMRAAAIKYQTILMTSTGSLARFRTRCNHFVVYEGYEGLYQRLRLGADNKSTKQSPIDRGNNCNNNNDESIFHLVGRVETRKCHLARQKSVRTHCCRTLKILSPGIKRLTSDIEFQE